MAGVEELRIPFSLRGINGQIAVSLTPNTDPASVGYSLLTAGLPVDFARGFPVCRAKVAFPADGYAAVFGWTQLVRPARNGANGFEMDPIAIYRDVSTPFCWYGIRPELFDAPSYEDRDDRDWEAHSFLCVSPDAVITPSVQAITGFSWGFTITSGRISLTEPAVLAPEDWDAHLATLRTSYPGWAFADGYLGT
jgi:hypothetical protein